MQQVLCNDGMDLNIAEAMTINVEIVTEGLFGTRDS